MSLVKIFVSVLFMVSIASGFLFMNCAKSTSQNQKSTSPSTGEKLGIVAQGYPTPTSMRIQTNVGGAVDTGFTGYAFNLRLPDNAVTTFGLKNCQPDSNNSGYFGDCDVTVPVDDPTIPAGSLGTDKRSTHRCTGDTSKVCTSNSNCTGFGTCKYFTSGPVPFEFDAGGWGCSVTYFNNLPTAIAGTVNLSTGVGTLNKVPIYTTVYSSLTGVAGGNHCPICSSTCQGGPKNGLACVVHSNLAGKNTSLDCPPNNSVVTALELDIGPLGTGAQQITLSSSSPVSSAISGNKPLYAGVCSNDNSPCSHTTGAITDPSACSSHNGGTCLGLYGMPNSCNNDGYSCPSGIGLTGVGGFIPDRPGNYCATTLGASRRCNNPAATTISGVAKRCVNDSDCGGGAGSCPATPPKVPCISGGANSGNILFVQGAPRASNFLGTYTNVTLGSVFPIGELSPTAPAISTFLGLPGPGRIFQSVDIDVYPLAALSVRSITVSKSGAGNGVVKSFPSGIDFPSDTRQSFPIGTHVILTATPTDSSSNFAGWSGGGCTGLGTCEVIITNTSVTVDALFNSGPLLVTNHTLNLIKWGIGSGKVASSPAGINSCDVFPCTASFPSGTQVTITPSASYGSKFWGWSGSDVPAICANQPTCVFTMTKNMDIGVTFSGLLTATSEGSGSGSISSVTNSFNCTNLNSPCTNSFPTSALVTLTAAPSQGSIFAGWTGICASFGTNPICTFTPVAGMVVGFTFTLTTPVGTGPTPAPTPPIGSVCPMLPKAPGVCAAGSAKGRITLFQSATSPSGNGMSLSIYPTDTSDAVKASYNTTSIFGDLTAVNPNAAYFCAYDSRGLLIEKQIPSGVLCGTKPCLGFKTDSIGFKANPPILGIKSVKASYKRVQIAARGIDFNVINPLPISGTLKVQFSSGLPGGRCWETEFTAPAASTSTYFSQ